MKSIFKTSLFVSLLIGLVACGGEEKKAAEKTVAAVPVKVAQVKAINVPVTKTYAATVKSETSVNLSTKMMGQISGLTVEEGQRVTQGEVIARIKSADLEAKKAQVNANRQEAQAAFSNAETNYKRIKTLADQKSATQKELDDIRTAMEMAKAKIAAIDQMEAEINEVLKFAVITAPISGVVTKKFMNTGDLASPGMPIVTLENDSEFEIIAKVPESDIAQLNTGQAVSVKIDAIGGKELAGKIAQLNPSGQYGGGMFEIKVKLNEKLAALKNGLFASVVIPTGQANKIMVPESAIIRKGQLEGLYTLNQQGEAMLRWLRLGKTYNGQVEILSGLSEGEQYITSAEGKLTDGIKVEVK